MNSLKNHRLVLPLCWILVVAVSSSHADARDYFVSSDGDDSHIGSRSQPWRTIERFNKLDLGPGDRVMFRAGDTFEGTPLFTKEDSGNNQQLVVIGSYGSGRATIDAGHGNGLVSDDCNDLTIQELILRGSGRGDGSNGSGILLKGGSHLKVDRVEVSGFRRCGVAINGVSKTQITQVYAHDNGHAGIASYNDRGAISIGLYVGYCVVEDNPGDPQNLTNHSGNGIVIGWARDVLVEYCVARHNGWDMPRDGNGPVGIWCHNAQEVVIQHCISYGNHSPGQDGGGFDIDGGTRNAILQYNLSYNNDGPGFILCQYPGASPLKNNIIRYNISQNDGQKNNRRSSIDIFAAGSNASGCEVYHNTVYNETGPVVGFGGYPISGVVFRNNIFVSGASPIVGDYSHARFEGNLWWMLRGQDFTVGKFESFDAWATATGQEKSGDIVVGTFADPRLSNVGKARVEDPLLLRQLMAYRLLPGSPCLAAGARIPNSGKRDFWGVRISNDLRPSVGACQASQSLAGVARTSNLTLNESDRAE